jgi:hypothetical protein
LLVGGGEVSCDDGGVGVRTAARVLSICDDGGGVMDNVRCGAGDTPWSGDAALEGLMGASDSERDVERILGVA